MRSGQGTRMKTPGKMPQRCPACGAVLPEGSDCQALFESFLYLENTDPDYGEVHFPLVATYMVQPGLYSDEALAWTRTMLRASRDEGIPPAEIRRRAGKSVSSDARTWKVTRPADAPPLPSIPWSITIADVARNQH